MYFPMIDRAISEYCHEKEVTLAAFAGMVGVSEKTLREKRVGRRRFSVEECIAISVIVRIPLVRLLAKPLPSDTDTGVGYARAL